MKQNELDDDYNKSNKQPSPWKGSTVEKCPNKMPKNVKKKVKKHLFVSSSNFLSEYFAIQVLKNYSETHSS